MTVSSTLRALLASSLGWSDAHVNFEGAVAGVPEESRGARPAGFPHSLWELVEHIRLTQADILEFCRNSQYVEPKWPDSYWPPEPEPPDGDAWDASVRRVVEDRSALQALAQELPELTERIPHGSGQTYLREIVLVVDHTSYHVGQIVAVRRLLGIWRAD